MAIKLEDPLKNIEGGITNIAGSDKGNIDNLFKNVANGISIDQKQMDDMTKMVEDPKFLEKLQEMIKLQPDLLKKSQEIMTLAMENPQLFAQKMKEFANNPQEFGKWVEDILKKKGTGKKVEQKQEQQNAGGNEYVDNGGGGGGGGDAPENRGVSDADWNKLSSDEKAQVFDEYDKLSPEEKAKVDAQATEQQKNDYVHYKQSKLNGLQ